MLRAILLPAILLLAACAQSPTSDATLERKMVGLLEKFDRFDYNGDGYLTKAEARQGIEEAGVEGVSEEEITKAWAFYDTDGDGRISLAEANAGRDRGPEAYRAS